MKRFLAGLLSLALVLAAPPASAWALFSEAARDIPVGETSAVGASAGIVRLDANAAAFVPALDLSSPGESTPEDALVVAPKISVSATVAARKAVVAKASKLSRAVRGALIKTGRALGSSRGRPAVVIESLFTGAASRAALAEDDFAPSARDGAPKALAAASARVAVEGPNVPAPVPDGAPRRPASKLLRAAKSIGRVALAAAAVVALNAAVVGFAPALFSVVPIAAAWAVSSGLLLFPISLYARHRLAKRDSPRLNKVKVLLDLALGAYAGAAIAAAPHLAVALSSTGALFAILPDLAAGFSARGLGPAAVGGLAPAPMLGMLALSAMTTIAFFLGKLIASAETGRPFEVPGVVQKIRFPSFQWVMIGVVFALLSGYTAVHTTVAFLAWNLLGSRAPSKWDGAKPLWKNIFNKAADFDLLYLGLFAFVAVGGFKSPLTFLVVAFSGERVAAWTERLLARFLPKSDPVAAPGDPAAHRDDGPSRDQARWPRYHYGAKTLLLLAAMTGIGLAAGLALFGFHSLLMGLLPTVAFAALPFWFAARIIKFVMRGKTVDEKSAPEFFAIMKGLREKLNAERRAQGKKDAPELEAVIDPLSLPTSYAVRDPSRAFVAVTEGLERMTLDPENVRDGVARLIANTRPGTKAFKVYRRAIGGSISGVTEASSSADIQAAVLKAGSVELKALGARALTGVLAREISHVMDHQLLYRAVSGALSASITLASSGVLWAVGSAEDAVKMFLEKILARLGLHTPATPHLARIFETGEGASRPQFANPVSFGAEVRSLPALFKLDAALWVPTALQIVQSALSRNNVGMADEHGALLSEDPSALALALGLLAGWRPRAGAAHDGADLSRVAALSFMMTVNPLEQGVASGVVPGLGGAAATSVGKGDDFLFNLFVPHLDTDVRVERLSDMADTLRAPKVPGRTANVPGFVGTNAEGKLGPMTRHSAENGRYN